MLHCMFIAYIGNFILDLWNLKCVFDFLVRKVRPVLKERKVRTNQLWCEVVMLYFCRSSVAAHLISALLTDATLTTFEHVIYNTVWIWDFQILHKLVPIV